MLLLGLADLVEVLAPRLELSYPFLGELTTLNGLELPAHPVLDRLVDDLRSHRHIAILGSLGDGESHSRNSTLIHEINNELQLMETFEVGHLRRVARFYEDLVTCLHKSGGPPTENALLPKKIGHCFLAEVGFEHTRTGATNPFGPCEGSLLGLPGSIVVDRNQGRHPLLLHELTAHRVPRSLGSHHDNIDIIRSINEIKMNGKSVREE